jgi:antirestriction protein
MNNIASTPAMASLPNPAVRPMAEWFLALGADTQAEITDMVNEEGYPLSDIEEFIETYGEGAFVAGHYVTWCELTESGHEMDAIEAYVDVVGIDCIDGYEDAIVGEYDSEADFARAYFDENYHGVDALEANGVVIDWQATWDSNLSYNYGFSNGYVFNTNV